MASNRKAKGQEENLVTLGEIERQFDKVAPSLPALNQASGVGSGDSAVSDDDVLAFWRRYFTTTVQGAEYTAKDPNFEDTFDRHMFEQMRAGIESDRRRVAERINA